MPALTLWTLFCGGGRVDEMGNKTNKKIYCILNGGKCKGEKKAGLYMGVWVGRCGYFRWGG